MNRIRLFALAAMVTAASIYSYSLLTRPHPLAWECLQRPMVPAVRDICLQAHAADNLTDQERGLVAFRLGYVTGQAGEWETALDYYNETIALYPQRIDAFHNRARILRNHLDDMPGAIADFDLFLKYRPTNMNGLTNRAETHRRMENLDLAAADLDRAAQIDPTNRYLMHTRAELLQDLDDDEGALAVLDHAIELHAENLALRRERSWVKRQLRDYEGALADINYAIANDPDRMWPWYQRGWLNIRLENYQAGLTDLQEALARDPSYRPARRQMSGLLSDIIDNLADEPEKLTRFADAGLVNDPDNTGLIFIRAIGQFGEGKFIGAVNDMNTVIAAAEHPQTLIFTRAAIYIEQGQFDLAIQDLDFLTRDPGIYTTSIAQIAERAQALHDAGQSDTAAKLDSDVGDLAVLYAKALQTRINLHQSLADWTGALEAIDLMVAYDGDSSRHWTTRGQILEQLGQPEDALASYSSAIRLIETNAPDIFNSQNAAANALLHRGALYQSQLRTVDAQNDFDAALQIGDWTLINAFQQKMQDAGHYTGPLNGVYDQATQSAVKSCAADRAC